MSQYNNIITSTDESTIVAEYIAKFTKSGEIEARRK